jgi:hypothetical protein
MGVHFNNWINEDFDVWNPEGMLLLDEPIVICIGNVQVDLLFYNTSHAKAGINTLTMQEVSYQLAP